MRLWPEGVRIGPRRGSPLELVPGEPERPGELQVITSSRLTEAGGGPRQVVALDVPDSRPCRQDGAGGVER